MNEFAGRFTQPYMMRNMSDVYQLGDGETGVMYYDQNDKTNRDAYGIPNRNAFKFSIYNSKDGSYRDFASMDEVDKIYKRRNEGGDGWMGNTNYTPLNIFGEERMTTIGNNRYAVLDQFDDSLDSSKSYSLLRNMRDNQVYINTAKGNFLVENPKLLKELRTGKVPINSDLLNKLTPNKIYMGEDGKYTQTRGKKFTNLFSRNPFGVEGGPQQ